jgi:hypothetical protein
MVHVGDLVGPGALESTGAAHHALGIGAGGYRDAGNFSDLRQGQRRRSFDYRHPNSTFRQS